MKDNGRRFKNTGYGQLARSLILSIHGHSEHSVVLDQLDLEFDEGIPNQELLREIPRGNAPETACDVILQVSPPGKIANVSKPTVFYTQNALGGIIQDWAGDLTAAAAVVVPGEFDRVHFSKHHPNVHICPQVVDTGFFKPMPQYRSEGSELPSFLFVGSYSYRKGADLIGRVFSRAFEDGAKISLHLHCFTGLEGRGLDKLIDLARSLPANVKLTADSRSISLPWMRRTINRHDCVFTLSRGEGWCMPLWEALYSGLAVVAPNSTAMGEYLPKLGVEKFEVDEIAIESISDPFGDGMRRRYGQPGITQFEPDINDAARAIRRAYDKLESLKLQARDNRDALADMYSYEMMGARMSEIIKDTVARFS